MCVGKVWGAQKNHETREGDLGSWRRRFGVRGDVVDGVEYLDDVRPCPSLGAVGEWTAGALLGAAHRNPDLLSSHRVTS